MVDAGNCPCCVKGSQGAGNLVCPSEHQQFPKLLYLATGAQSLSMLKMMYIGTLSL